MSSIYACTVFGSIGDVNKQRGLLLVKNREVAQLGLEKLFVVKPKDGVDFLGLFYNTDVQNNQAYPYLAAGINRAGVVVVNNTIITVKVETSLAEETRIIKTILSHYLSTDAILRDAKKLFSSGSPNHLLVGDVNQILSIEIGKHGVYRIRQTKNSYLYHTNHYVSDKTMEEQNENTHVASTYERYALIGQLLRNKASQPYTFNEYLHWLTEQNHGFSDSLFRSMPHPTVATWIVSIPKDKKTNKNMNPFLYVRFTNPLQGYANYQLNLDKNFWKHPKINNIHTIILENNEN